jgi:ABC-type Fe3+-hydroxamate transport system substrate-binding protein
LSGHLIPRDEVPVVHYRIAASLVAFVLAGCAGDRGAPDSAVDRSAIARDEIALRVDDFGDTIALGTPPTRIVSLNPATTELLFALGAGGRLVGRTHWDVWPEEAVAVPDLGPGLRPDVEAVLAARPDLVVLYAGADNRPAADRLRSAGVATLSLKVDRIEHFERAARVLGRILGDTTSAARVVDTVRATLDSVRAATSATPRRPRVVWPVDISPLIVIGGGSFLNQLIEIAGGVNVYGDLAAVSPQLALEDVHRRDPDIVLANPSLAARIRVDPAWRVLRAVREGAIVEADETLMGRQSVRMGEAAVSLARLLHAEGSRR